MLKINQDHRVRAANKIPLRCDKDKIIRQRILDGQADEHPLVQAEAHYETH